MTNIWKNSVRTVVKLLVSYCLPLEDRNTDRAKFLIHLQGFSFNTWKKLVEYARSFAIMDTPHIDRLLTEMFRKFLVGDIEDNEKVNERMARLFQHSRLSPERKQTFYEPKKRLRHFTTLCESLEKNKDDRINNQDDDELRELNFDLPFELLETFPPFQAFEDNNLQNDQGEAIIERNEFFSSWSDQGEANIERNDFFSGWDY